MIFRLENCSFQQSLQIFANVCSVLKLKFWKFRSRGDYRTCRSRWALSNEYLVAKIGLDTYENEPLKVWRKHVLQITILITCRAACKLRSLVILMTGWTVLVMWCLPIQCLFWSKRDRWEEKSVVLRNKFIMSSFLVTNHCSSAS